MILNLLTALLLSGQAHAQSLKSWTPIVQQTGLYYSSDRVTMGGMGIGAGVRFNPGKHLVSRADAAILWGNGNAVSTRLSVGYQRNGLWTPAVFGAFGLLWGQRTEVLSENGLRPDAPVWIAGVRLSPIRFNVTGSSVSALEVGYGFGPDRGRWYELTILSADLRW